MSKCHRTDHIAKIPRWGEGAEVNLEFSYLHASRGINKKIITEVGGKCGGVGWGVENRDLLKQGGDERLEVEFGSPECQTVELKLGLQVIGNKTLTD